MKSSVILKRDSWLLGIISGVAVYFVYIRMIDAETILSYVLPGLVYGIVSSILFYKHVCKKYFRLILWTIACTLSFYGAFLSCMWTAGDGIEWWTFVLASFLGSSVLLISFSVLFHLPGISRSIKIVVFPALIAYVFGWMINPEHSVGSEMFPYLFLFVAWQTLVTVFLCSENGDKTKNSENVG